jgi:phosphoribosylformylglycinamidine synthase
MNQVGVIRFPGTNCDRDVFEAAAALGVNPQWLWYQDRFTPSDFKMVILPGGFSFGDYLRCGALAARSPVMDSVRELASRGGRVLGICNGFQILCESGLLPGVLTRNKGLRFLDRWTTVRVETDKDQVLGLTRGQEMRLPIAHAEGRFQASPDELRRLEEAGQIWLRYAGENPNGSVSDVAGVLSSNGRVGALMPHPERAMAEWMGSADGRTFLQGVLNERG